MGAGRSPSVRWNSLSVAGTPAGSRKRPSASVIHLSERRRSLPSGRHRNRVGGALAHLHGNCAQHRRRRVRGHCRAVRRRPARSSPAGPCPGRAGSVQRGGQRCGWRRCRGRGRPVAARTIAGHGRHDLPNSPIPGSNRPNRHGAGRSGGRLRERNLLRGGEAHRQGTVGGDAPGPSNGESDAADARGGPCLAAVSTESRRGAPMLNTFVSCANFVAGRLMSGVVALSLDHPIVLCVILATLAGASLAVLLDVVADHMEARSSSREDHERPIRLRRS